MQRLRYNAWENIDREYIKRPQWYIYGHSLWFISISKCVLLDKIINHDLTANQGCFLCQDFPRGLRLEANLSVRDSILGTFLEYFSIILLYNSRPFNLHPNLSRVPSRPDFSRVLSEIFLGQLLPSFFQGGSLKKAGFHTCKSEKKIK